VTHSDEIKYDCRRHPPISKYFINGFGRFTKMTFVSGDCTPPSPWRRPWISFKSVAAVVTALNTANYDVIHHAGHFKTICVWKIWRRGPLTSFMGGSDGLDPALIPPHHPMLKKNSFAPKIEEMQYAVRVCSTYVIT